MKSCQIFHSWNSNQPQRLNVEICIILKCCQLWCFTIFCSVKFQFKMADLFGRVVRTGELMWCPRVLKGTIHHYEATVSLWWSTIPARELSHGSVHVHSFNWARFPLGFFPLGLFQLVHPEHVTCAVLCWVHQRNMGAWAAFLDPFSSTREETVQANVCTGSRREDKLAVFLYLIWWLP